MATELVYFAQGMIRRNGPAAVRRCDVVLTRSTSFSPTTRRVASGQFVILVPVGLFARVRVLARLLLRFWDRPSQFAFVNPAQDKYPTNVWIPKRLAPIFATAMQDDDERYWASLAELNRGMTIPAQEDKCGWTRMLKWVYLFMFMHELGHVLLRHHDFVDWLATAPKRVKAGLTQDQVLRGLELQSDYLGADLSTKVAFSEFFISQSADPEPRSRSVFLDPEPFAAKALWQWYSVSLLLSAFDTHLKSIEAYTPCNTTLTRSFVAKSHSGLAAGSCSSLRRTWSSVGLRWTTRDCNDVSPPSAI